MSEWVPGTRGAASPGHKQGLGERDPLHGGIRGPQVQGVSFWRWDGLAGDVVGLDLQGCWQVPKDSQGLSPSELFH